MGETLLGLLIVGAVVVAFLVYQRSQARAPVYEIAADDPEMIAARQRARDTLDGSRRLFDAGAAEAGVKVPVSSSSGTIEFMIGDLVELTDVYVKIQFRGKPVTHSGAFQPIQSFPLREIADWFVVLPTGKIRGGFTQRVHFDRLRASGRLHGIMNQEAAKYE
jgi:hypothetical protein